MSVLAFLSEPFVKYDGRYYSHKASLGFVKACFSNDKVIPVGRVVEGDISQSSVDIPENEFEGIYNYTSIVDFFKKSILNPLYFVNYIKRCDNILDKYPDSKIWVRNPSIGCLIFSLRALKKERKIYNHMCANAMNAWENKKYSGLLKGIAYLFSLVLKMMVIKVVSNSNTINLCTGKELEDFCLKYNHRSYQIIDSNIISTCDNKISLNVPFKFLFIGRIQKDKGIGKLLEQFSQMDEASFHLDVVGDGVILDELKRKFRKDNIVFHGQLSNSKLPEVLGNANVVVVPSDNKYEGFPRVILEAWSHCLPVIVSDVGGVRAFVEHEKNGLLFDWGTPGQLMDAMHKISDMDFYENMIENCRKIKHITTEAYWVDEFKRIEANGND